MEIEAYLLAALAYNAMCAILVIGFFLSVFLVAILVKNI